MMNQGFPSGVVELQQPPMDALFALDTFLLDGNGFVRQRAAVELRAIDPGHLRFWMHMRARYMIPTEELIDWLVEQLYADNGEDQSQGWLEIGAGSGDLAHHLGITATDSFFQNQPKIRLIYEAAGQPLVKYGKNVQKLDAIAAAKKYKPHTVIASWVTQVARYGDPIGEGCAGGVDESHLLRLCKRYIFIGNESSHHAKRILGEPHRVIDPCPAIVSRGNPETDRIWIWERP